MRALGIISDKSIIECCLFVIAFHFKIYIPGACHQNDRDRTREFLMSWIKITSRKQPWFHKVS